MGLIVLFDIKNQLQKIESSESLENKKRSFDKRRESLIQIGSETKAVELLNLRIVHVFSSIFYYFFVQLLVRLELEYWKRKEMKNQNK